MAKMTFGSPSFSVDINDDDVERMIRASIEKVAPDLLDIVESVVDDVYQEAHSRWPVGPYKRERGGRHSKDELDRAILISPDGTIRGRVYNDAEWAKYIKPKGLKGKTAFVALLRKPFEARIKPLNERLKAAVIAALEG